MEFEAAGSDQAPAIRVLLVDDHPLVRQGVRWFLEGQPDIEVVGEAADAEQALELVRRVPVDVAVLDVRLPGMDGIAATRVLRAGHPSVRVLILTAFSEYLAGAIAAGAAGYLLKTARGLGLVSAIRSIYFGATVIQDALGDGRPRPGAGAAAAAQPATPLTSRELEVLRLIARGLTNRAIARSLRIGPRTAEQHVHSIFVKLGIGSRAAAVRYALEHDLAGGPPAPAAND